jgi:hypothetical protein
VTSIDFYFNAGDRLDVACRLAGKALQQKAHAHLRPQARVGAAIDRMLGPRRFPFAALLRARPLAARRRSDRADDSGPRRILRVLLNLSAECRLSSSARAALEIVTQDDAQAPAGRALQSSTATRLRIRNHDLRRGRVSGNENPRATGPAGRARRRALSASRKTLTRVESAAAHRRRRARSGRGRGNAARDKALAADIERVLVVR